jgi:hypothetical protein
MNKIKDIKHWYEGAYVLPFHIDHPDYCLYIFDKNGDMVMSYADEYDEPYRETTKEICNILNDDGGVIHSLERDGLEFKVNGFLFYIRGWGHLTGIGGLYLPVTKAKEIQDEFADCVYNKLKYHLK